MSSTPNDLLLTQLGAEGDGLVADRLNDFGAGSVRHAGEVLDAPCHAQCARGERLVDDQGGQLGPGCVHGGRSTAGATANHNDIVDFGRLLLWSLFGRCSSFGRLGNVELVEDLPQAVQAQARDRLTVYEGRRYDPEVLICQLVEVLRMVGHVLLFKLHAAAN